MFMTFINKYFSSNYKVWVSAGLFWIFLFVASMPFINPETGDYNINKYYFHLIMFFISLITLFFTFKYFKKKGWYDLKAIYTFLFVNILLDWLLLIPVFGVLVSEWFMEILPSYLLGTFIIYKILKK